MEAPRRRDVIAGLAASALATGPAWSQTARPGRLRAADTQAADFPTVQALYFIERFLRARPESGLSLQVFSGAQLGEENEIIEQTRAGAIDLARVNVASLADRAPICSLFCLPDLVRSDAHLDAVLASPLAAEIAASLDAMGLMLLTFYDSGARSIYNRLRPVRVPADLAGMSIRVQSCEIMKRVVRRLGARPVELGFSQLQSALQAALIDGAENNWPSYVTTDQYLVAPYLTLTQHARPPEVLVISKARWSDLAPAERSALRAAAEASRGFMRALWREWTDLSKRIAANAQVNVVDTFPRAEFLTLLRPLQDEWITEMGLTSAAEQIERLKS